MFLPLPFLPIKTTKSKAYKLKVLFFDPTDLYKRITIEPNKRYQSHLKVEHLFPKLNNNLCNCGCGQPLTDRQTRWSLKNCNNFAYDVYSIIYGDLKTISSYLQLYKGSKECSVCGSRENIELDHIKGIKHNGGGGWLSNYDFKCKTCHRIKTNKDFGWGKKVGK